MNERTANAIYDLLVRLAGASNREFHRQQFVQIQTEGCTEYRFCGALGFGGKFWNGGGRWEVTAYPEDIAAWPDLQLVITTTNNALYELRRTLLALTEQDKTTV